MLPGRDGRDRSGRHAFVLRISTNKDATDTPLASAGRDQPGCLGTCDVPAAGPARAALLVLHGPQGRSLSRRSVAPDARTGGGTLPDAPGNSVTPLILAGAARSDQQDARIGPVEASISSSFARSCRGRKEDRVRAWADEALQTCAVTARALRPCGVTARALPFRPLAPWLDKTYDVRIMYLHRMVRRDSRHH